ncbi:MAG: hypothetical protein EZS28_019620 [Streblomastix strix]|uniref:Uncharacterized protein n=1 Tax=Streblomastix strix TaxID=222440 RepID=A0A5J4VQD4_9EUKA|nr:MAG: hypothetical protein EZS28_019620 [Streblomastix strix]
MEAMDPKKMICTEPFLYKYMKAFDELLLINELFNRKESPSNEISHRNRVITTTSKTSAQDVMQDMSTLELQKFFADKSCIINVFRKAFDAIPCIFYQQFDIYIKDIFGWLFAKISVGMMQKTNLVIRKKR